MPDITAIIRTAMPAILAIIQARHNAANPDAPPLTDVQVFTALHDWAVETAAKDDALAAEIRARNPGA